MAKRESLEAYRASLSGQPFTFPDPETYQDCFDLVGVEGDLNECLTRLCHRMGFEYFSLVTGDVGSTSILDEDLTVTSSYPEEWRRYYRVKRYISIDPIVFYSQRTTEPFFWGRDEDIRSLDRQTKQMMNEGREIGISHGISVPTHGPGGALTLLSMISGDGLSNTLEMARKYRNLLWMIAPIVHSRCVKQYRPQRDEELVLTETQRKCLRWTLQGKTSWEISRILSLSKATVDYHLQRAMRKLEVVSKVQAASEAFRRGLL